MARLTTYPGAIMQDRSKFSGVTMPAIEKVLWHTTESAGWPAYPTFAPQLTVDPLKRQVRQHMELNRSATTLVDPGSTAVRENRDSVVQIEIVGYCDPRMTGSPAYTGKWGDEEYRFLASIAAWFYTEWGVPLTSSVDWVSYPASYGLNAPQRLTSAEYDSYRGHLGHQHASGNAHGDPGRIDMARLLRFARDIAGSVPPTTPPPPPPGRPVPQPFAPGQILPGGSITTPFGVKGDWAAGFHPGDDWNVGEPTEDYWFPLYATKPGVVTYVGEDGWGADYGRHVIVEYADGRRGAFCHMAAFSVKAGQRVEPGTQVGRVGYSGNVRPEGQPGSHCHYEERVAPYRYGEDARQPIYTATAWTWDGRSYPGSERLREGAEGPWVTLFGQRLVKHGYRGYAEGPGPVWGPKDSEGVVWLKRKQGWKGGPGVGQATWDLAMSAPDPEPEPKSVEVRFVAWNVWDNRDLAVRIPRLVKVLRELKGDIIAFQEYGSNEYPQIYEGVDGLDYYPAGNRHIAWRKSTWKPLEKRKVTLKPDRQVPAVLLEHLTTGARVWAYSVHLTNLAENAALRLRQTAELLRFLDGLKRIADVPIIGGGDINSIGTVGDPGAVRAAMRAAGYRDLIQATGKAPDTQKDRRIDEVFFTPPVEVVKSEVREEDSASDHAALNVLLSIPIPIPRST